MRRQYFNNISMDNSKSKVRNSEIKCAIRKKKQEKEGAQSFHTFQGNKVKVSVHRLLANKPGDLSLNPEPTSRGRKSSTYVLCHHTAYIMYTQTHIQ